MAKLLNTRAAAANIAWHIIDKGQSLDKALANYFEAAQLSAQDRAFIQELVYGICRWYGELDALAGRLLRSPIRNKDRVIHFVLLVGLYQLQHLKTAEHAAVGETVSACKQLNKQWAKKLINGCLRNFLRDPTKLDSTAPNIRSARLSHPEWIRNAIDKAWHENADAIFLANSERPPMCLRVNQRQHTRDEYLAQLEANNISATSDPFTENGITLAQPVPVFELPGFMDGACSVQDTAAQLAAEILTPSKGMRVLDACAAPGGKTAHLLEHCDNNLDIQALDISEQRCTQLHTTLGRLKLGADIIVADASIKPIWETPTKGYDRILIDAPCSGLGVVRRHPDIKHHRRPSDIQALMKTQHALLTNLWPLVKPAGQLLYMTCSILPNENDQQIKRFVGSQNDAMLIKIDHPNALTLEYGVQTLPGVHSMDGFYYCLLEKN